MAANGCANHAGLTRAAPFPYSRQCQGRVRNIPTYERIRNTASFKFSAGVSPPNVWIDHPSFPSAHRSPASFSIIGIWERRRAKLSRITIDQDLFIIRHCAKPLVICNPIFSVEVSFYSWSNILFFKESDIFGMRQSNGQKTGFSHFGPDSTST